MTLQSYTCLECGAEFDEPREWEEHHGLDSPPYERWSGCPVCGGPYVQTHVGDHCGDQIFGSMCRTADGGEYCENCFDIYDIGD